MLHMNTEIFEKEVVFSIDATAFNREMLNILGDTVGRYNAERNNLFFYLFKDDINYPKAAMKAKRMNLDFREAGNMVWVRMEIPAFKDPRLVERLEGSPFHDMSGVLIYPFVTVSGGRVHFTVQYRKEAEAQVSERLLSLMEVHSEVLGHESFRIEYIGKARAVYDSIMREGRSFSVIVINARRRKEPASIFSDINVLNPAWPASVDGVLRTMKLEEVLNNVEGPDAAIRRFFDNFVRKSVAAPYLEVVIEGDKVSFRTILESDLMEGLMDNIYDSVRDGLRISIGSIYSLEQSVHREDSGYLNTEFFRNEVIFSVDISKAYPEYSGIMDSGIAYYDSKTRSYYFSILKSQDKYNEDRMKLRRKEIIMMEDRDAMWIKFDNIIYIRDEIGRMLPGKTLSDMEGAILYPFSVVKGGRLYHLCQFNDTDSEAVTARLASLSSAYNRNLGRGAFRIHEIRDALAVTDFLGMYYDLRDVTKIEIEIPSHLNASGLQKNHSNDLGEIKFVVKMGEATGLVSIRDLISGLDIPGESMERAMEETVRNYIIALYFESRCSDGRCHVTWLYESRYVPSVMKILGELNRGGGAVRLKGISVLE